MASITAMGAVSWPPVSAAAVDAATTSGRS